MKQYKIDILQKLNERAKGERIISLRETANQLGIKHLKTQECLEISNLFLKKQPEYKAVKFIDNPLDSLFCSLTFVDKNIEFSEEK